MVLGDLNEPPNGPAWSRLTEVLVDTDPGGAPTFPAVEPRLRIDAILVTPDLRTGPAHVPSHPPVHRASDHRPVLVDITTP